MSQPLRADDQAVTGRTAGATWVRGVAGALAAAGLSAAGGAVLVSEALRDANAGLVFGAAMGLVAVATVVGSLTAGRFAGLLLAAPPISFIGWVAVVEEGDAQGAIAGFIITFAALLVSVAAWSLVLLAAHARRRRHRGQQS